MGFEIAYNNKEVTPWGGMVLLREILEKINFSGAIESCADFATNAGILLGRTTDSTYKLYGSLDDVRLYDYQLTESDISDIYNLLKSAKVSTGAFDQVDSGITVFPVPCADFLTINGSMEIR